MDAERGDKVLLKSSEHGGRRAVVENVRGTFLTARLESGELVQVSRGEVTNYSLAARKAWAKMPERRVGRPKGSTTTDRVSVTLRIDRKLWEQFRRAEAAGQIADRTAAINEWIAQKLAALDQ